MKFFFVVATLIFFSACASMDYRKAVVAGGESNFGKFIYKVDEENARAVLINALQNHAIDKIFRLKGDDVIAYSMSRNRIYGFHKTYIGMFPKTVISENGTVIKGFQLLVKGEGNSKDGVEFDSLVYNYAAENLSKVGQRIALTRQPVRKELIPKQAVEKRPEEVVKNKIDAIPSFKGRSEGVLLDMSTRLRALKKWHDEGLITSEEYTKRKSEILSGL